MIGGIGLTTSGALSIINIFSLLNPLHLLIEVYLCIFGMVIVVLETQDFSCTAGLRDSIREYAKFLTFVGGRAAFYAFAGSLSLAQFPNFIDTIVGGYLIGMGFLSIIVGKATSMKLQHLKSHLKTDEACKGLFDQFDGNHDGRLDRLEFGKLALALGADLSVNEINTAMSVLDPNGSGDISFDDFMSWWREEKV